MNTPAHYRPGTGATPWDLQRNMQSCGNLFADARRADAIKYAHRMKSDIIGDLEKAIHCLQEAVAELKKSPNVASQETRDRCVVSRGDFGVWHIRNILTGQSEGAYATKEAAKIMLEKCNEALQTSEPVISSPPNPA